MSYKIRMLNNGDYYQILHDGLELNNHKTIIILYKNEIMSLDKESGNHFSIEGLSNYIKKTESEIWRSVNNKNKYIKHYKDVLLMMVAFKREEVIDKILRPDNLYNLYC